MHLYIVDRICLFDYFDIHQNLYKVPKDNKYKCLYLVPPLLLTVAVTLYNAFFFVDRILEIIILAQRIVGTFIFKTEITFFEALLDIY